MHFFLNVSLADVNISMTWYCMTILEHGNYMLFESNTWTTYFPSEQKSMCAFVSFASMQMDERLNNVKMMDM